MGFKVLYHLTTNNLKGIAEEAKWAESMGYDGLCTEETLPMTPCCRCSWPPPRHQESPLKPV